MTRTRSRALLHALFLAGCGALPQPFYGNPGHEGLRLSQPPPARLAVPTPSDSLLTDAASGAWAEATAKALADRALPASHDDKHAGDWTLTLSAALRGKSVVPDYIIRDSGGAERGQVQGTAIPVAAWSRADPALLQQAAADAAPKIDTLLSRIEAARLQSDPNSLLNRPNRVYLAGVKGAPGDGNQSLAEQMRRKLASLGIVVQDTKAGADYEVRGVVKAEPEPPDQLRIELAWTVDDARGERGKVTQLNQVPRASISGYWGDVASVAAEQAAGGIKEVLDNAARPPPPAPTPAPAEPPKK